MGKKEACPYASKIQDGSVVSSCPVLQGDSCPFNKSPEQIKQTVLQIPSSHYDDPRFVNVLREMHQKTNNGNDAAAPTVAVVCPVKEVLPDKNISFTQALENMSLASIIAKMAEREEQQQEQRHSEAHKVESSDSLSSRENEPLSRDQHVDKRDAPPTTDKTRSKRQEQQRQPSLSQSLKHGTAASHTAAENVHFVRNFVKGKIDRHQYAVMILQLYHVYKNMEILLEQHAPDCFGTCYFPLELNRTTALEQDLDFWHNNSSTNTEPTPATVDYINRLEYIAKTDPILLLAHAYTRYLGDLSGGKVLARVAKRALHLVSNDTSKQTDGLAFYHFDNVISAKLFKDKYRQALDELPLSTSQLDKIVAEANVAFALNMRLFEELDVLAGIPGCSVRPLEEALAYANVKAPPRNHAETANAEEKCPFLKKQQHDAHNNNNDNTMETKKRCPWPFVFAHDPVTGMRDWQTWLVLGLLLCWLWSRTMEKN